MKHLLHHCFGLFLAFFGLLSITLSCAKTNAVSTAKNNTAPFFPKEWKIFVGVSQNYVPTTEELSVIPEALDGKAAVTKPYTAEMDFAPLFGGVAEGNTAWLYGELNAAEAQEYPMGIGADWWCAVYLNGQEAFSTLKSGNELHPPQMNDHRFTLSLQKGKNIIAVKFVSGSGSSVLCMGGRRELANSKGSKQAMIQAENFQKLGVPLEVTSVVPKDLNAKLATGMVPEGYVIDSHWNKLLRPSVARLIGQNQDGSNRGEVTTLAAGFQDGGFQATLQGAPALQMDEKFYVILQNEKGQELYGRFGTLQELGAKVNADGTVSLDIPGFRPYEYGEAAMGSLFIGICNRHSWVKFKNAIPMGGKSVPGESAVLRIENGAAGPTPMLNGKPFFFTCFTIHPYIPERTIPTGMEGHDSPVNVIAARFGGNGASEDWWYGPGQYDFTRVDWCLDSMIRDFPDAKLALYLWCHPGNWYAKAYPERIAKDENGNPMSGYYVSMVSFSDEAMQQDTLRAFDAFTKHVEKYFGSKIVLYNLMGGISCEWQGWGSHGQSFTDYSDSSLQAFQKYAAARGMAVDHIPTPAEHKHAEGGIFRNPITDKMTMLYDRFYSESIAEFIDKIASTIKQASNGDKLVGCYYGYHQEYSNMGYTLNRGGHNDTERLMASPNIDFLLSPQSYSVRSLGAPNADMKPYGAARGNGKFSIMEDDTRTHRLDECGYDQALNLDQTVKLLRRNIGMYLCHRMPLNQLGEHGGDEMDDPVLKDLYAKALDAGQFIMEQPEADVTQIAAVIDEKSFQFIAARRDVAGAPSCDNYSYDYSGKLRLTPSRSIKPLTGDLLGYQRYNLAHIGAPVDIILLDDVAKTAGKYKLVIFLSAFGDTQELRQAYRALREKNVAILTAYGAGFMTERRVSAEVMSSLLGIQIAQTTPGTLEVTMKDGKTVGNPYSVDPRFAVTDKNTVAYGQYKDNGATAIARKGNEIFYGAACLSPDFLRCLAKELGIHVYLETGDNLYAGAHCVSIHAKYTGDKTIVLPGKFTVVDAWTGETIAKNACQFTVHMDAMDSRLFLLK
ncbi:MAG: beta-galactosidase [Lentisphaeria bacterium]|nr:beta-galactosidase [Lentisphaeria bacterium]